MNISVIAIYGTAFRTVFRNFAQLVRVTAAPVVLYLLANAGLIYISILEKQARLSWRPPPLPDGGTGQFRVSRGYAFSSLYDWQTWALMLLVILAALWLIVRLTRRYLRNQGTPVVLGELSSYLGSCLYGSAIFLLLYSPSLLTFAWAFFKQEWLSVKMGIFHLGNPSWDAFPHWFSYPSLRLVPIVGKATSMEFGIVVGLLSLLCFSVVSTYVLIRFWAAMPGVMLGHRPNLFRDMWPLAKPITWRFTGMGVLCLIGIGIAYYAILETAERLIRPVGFPWNEIAWVSITTFANIPLFWFGALVFAEAYTRLVKAKSQSLAST